MKNEAPKVKALTEAVKQAKEELKPHKDKLNEAHKEINEGRLEMVACEDQFIFDKQIVRTVRLDNDEVVATRAMKPKDRNVDAFDSEKEVEIEDA